MNPILARILLNLVLAGGLALIFFSTQRNWGGPPALIAGLVLAALGILGLMINQTRRRE